MYFWKLLPTKTNVDNIPQIQVDGADVRHKLLGLEVKLTEVLNFQSTHLRTNQVLQEVVQHGDDSLSQERVHKDPLDLCKWIKKLYRVEGKLEMA